MRLKKKNLHLDQTIEHDVLQHYGFRKLASGALVSAIIGTFFIGIKTETVSAAVDNNATQVTVKETSSQTSTDNLNVKTDSSSSDKTLDNTLTDNNQTIEKETNNTEAKQVAQTTEKEETTAQPTQISQTDTARINVEKDLKQETVTTSKASSVDATIQLLESKVDATDKSKTESTAKSVTFNNKARLSISRNTIGATGDTTAIAVDFNVSNPKKGDQYQIVIPKGTYDIGTDGQNIQSGGTTTIANNDKDKCIITNTFTDDNAGTIHQQFTLKPGNNYGGQPTPMEFIGDVLKKITITKKDEAGNSETKELNFTQVVSPEMNPTFKRTNPIADSVRALPNTDYTYELDINETSGVAKGLDYYSSKKVNSAVNTNTIITIPVPDSFVLNQDKTYTINDFGDETTITQDGGPGGTIVIHVPRGSGRQHWNNGPFGYRIVGHYAVAQPVDDTVIMADKKINIDQTITKADGSTYHINKDLDQRWTETLLGSKSNNEVPKITLSADVYAQSHQIPQDVDPSRPVNFFGFSNTSNQDITTAKITLTFPDGLNINHLDTPYDPVNLPDTTSYAYTITYTDGQTNSGTIQAGQSIEATDNQSIAKVVITPNVISAGAIFNGDNRIKVYGTVNKTLKDGTPIQDNHEFDSKIAFEYFGLIKGDTYAYVYAGPLDARQNLAEPKASVGIYYEQHKRMPGDNDAGFLSVYSNADGNATSHSVLEPIFYYVLPEGTVYNGNFDRRWNQPAEQQPKITHFTVDGQEVVKLDYTGTGYIFDTTAVHNNDIHINNLPLAEIGSHKWAIYMYSPHIKMLNTPAKDYSDWKSTQTEGKSDNVYVLGNGNWTISTAQQVHIASGIKGPNDAFAVDNTTADDKHPGPIEYDVRINNNLQKVNDGVAVININDDADNNFDFAMTTPVAVPNNVEVLYSTTQLSDNNTTTGYVPNLDNYVAWDQVTDKSKIKSVAIKFSSLDKGSNTGIFKIIGTDKNFVADAGKSVSFKSTLYSSDLTPLAGKVSTINIAGKSTVKVELVDPDGNVVNDVDLSHLNHTYEDNIDRMNQHDFDLNDSDKQAIKHYVDQLNSKDHIFYYEFDEKQVPTIKDSNAKKATVEFNRIVNYYFDGSIIQYKITKTYRQKALLLFYDDTDDTSISVAPVIYVDGKTGENISFNIPSSYDFSKYDFVSVTRTNDSKQLTGDKLSEVQYGKFDNDDNTDQVFIAHFTHKTTPDTQTVSVKEHIDYRYENEESGSSASSPVDQTVQYSRTRAKDLVDGSYSDWSDWKKIDNGQFEDKISPDVKNFKPDKESISAPTADQISEKLAAYDSKSGKNIEFKHVVYYSPKQGTVTVHYIDVNDAAAKDPNKTSFTKDEGTEIDSYKQDLGTKNYGEDYTNTLKDFGKDHYVLATTEIDPAAKNGTVQNPTTDLYIFLKHELEDSDEHATVQEIVHYNYDNGQKAHDDQKSNIIQYARKGKKDLVTQNITWDKSGWQKDDSNKNFEPIKSPTITGYTPDKVTLTAMDVDTKKLNKDTPLILEATVTYKADTQKARLRFYDDTEDKFIDAAPDMVVDGKTNGDINFAPQYDFRKYDFISVTKTNNPKSTAKLIGDKLSEVQYGKFDNDDNTEQIFMAHFKHHMNEVIATATVQEVVHYNFEDGTLASPHKGSKVITYTRSGQKDLVTNIIQWNSWHKEDPSETFEDIISPTIKGYTPNRAKVSPMNVDTSKLSQEKPLILETTVVYTPNPRLEPSDDPSTSPTDDHQQPESHRNDESDNEEPETQKSIDEQIKKSTKIIKKQKERVKKTKKIVKETKELEKKIIKKQEKVTTQKSAETPFQGGVLKRNIKPANDFNEQLPQTGEKTNNLDIIGLLTASLVGLLGLGEKKKRKD